MQIARRDDAGHILSFDHVQVTAPQGTEDRARAFYGEILGLEEAPKPAALAGRGGVWYRVGHLHLHLGLEDDFVPARKAHPAFLVNDLDAIRVRLIAAGCVIVEDVQFPGYRRFETRDPFGNRLELLQRNVDQEVDSAPEAERVKERVRDMFGRAAQAYVDSAGHASGDDLARLVELAAPNAGDFALDVSTGGGHTALAVAWHAGRVVASDLTPRMLAAARRFIQSSALTNVEYVVADAEHLPFLDETFTLVTVRIAPHHYADVRAAVREMARVLVPGGRIVIVDNIAPEDPELDRYMNDWEKRRDPSHVRAYTATEWRAFIAEAGLRITDLEIAQKAHSFSSWAKRMQMPPEERAAVERDILAASPKAHANFVLVEHDGRLTSWSTDYFICHAVK